MTYFSCLVEQLPRHDLFVMLEKALAGAAEAKFIEKSFTGTNHAITVNLKPVFPLAVDKFDKVNRIHPQLTGRYKRVYRFLIFSWRDFGTL